MQYVCDIKDLPKEKHFGVFYTDYVSVVDYDDRSCSVPMVKYISFSDQGDLQKYIDSQIRGGKRLSEFIIAETTPKKVKTDIIVSLE